MRKTLCGGIDYRRKGVENTLRTVIINQFSPKRVDYEKALNGIDSEVILLTKKKHEPLFEGAFQQVLGFDHFDENDSLYHYIVELDKRSKIDRVVATHEYDLIKAGLLRDYLGVQGQSSESAIVFRDKYEMKKRLEQVIKTPTFKRIRNAFDLIKFKDTNGYPFVVKPIDGAGSMGVTIIKDDSSFNDYLIKGVDDNLIAESFVEGDMYHVDGLFEEGELKLSIPSKYINGCLAFQDEDYDYVASFMLEKENPLYTKLNNAVQKVLLNLVVPDHAIAFHAEFFYTDKEEIIFCEIASRVGGGMISEAIEYSTGVDILSESIRAQLGVTLDLEVRREELCGFILIPPKKGKLLSINQDIPFDWVVDRYLKEDDIGKEFDGAESSVDSIVSLVIKGSTESEIQERFKMIYKWYEKNIQWELK